MGQLAHYSVVEICDDNEILNVGTFTNITNDKQGCDNLNERLKEALYEHLDCEYSDFTLLPYIDDFNCFFKVIVYDCEHKFSIDETWIY